MTVSDANCALSAFSSVHQQPLSVSGDTEGTGRAGRPAPVLEDGA